MKRNEVQRLVESKINEVVEKNLQLMKSSEIGGLYYLSSNESVGGNAGFWEGCSCYCANFCYNPDSGEIKYFGNFQSIPAEVIEGTRIGSFIMAITEMKFTPPCSMKDLIIRSSFKAKTEEAQSNLERTIVEYNEKYGYDPRTKP